MLNNYRKSVFSMTYNIFYASFQGLVFYQLILFLISFHFHRDAVVIRCFVYLGVLELCVLSSGLNCLRWIYVMFFHHLYMLSSNSESGMVEIVKIRKGVLTLVM